MEAAKHQSPVAEPQAEDPVAERLLVVAVHQQADGYQHAGDHQEDNNNGGAGWTIAWSMLAGFGFLTFNSAMAIIRSNWEPAAVAFVGFSYGDLVALFLCLRMYERAPAGSSKRDWLKVAVWVLTTLLTLAFSGKVAAVMPPAVAVLVWLMAFATIAGGFVAFFVYKEKKGPPKLKDDMSIVPLG